jgi:hypothetical protein
MQSSPKGREIEYVEGSPDVIIERGNAITTLGDQMLASADVLENIKNRAIDSGSQKGKAIDALRESIGDSYRTLREAGELYQPVGPVIATYGEALDGVQPLIRSAVDESQDLWDTYAALPGELEPRGTGGLFEPDEGSAAAERQAAEDTAKKAAYDAWEDRADDFDRHYDTWEEAFDTAVENIGDEMAGSIKDSFWSSIVDVLGWVAFTLGVIALIFTGPFIAALALVAAAAYLFVVAMQYANGEADWGDIALAAVAIVPIGKITTIAKLSQLRRATQKTRVVNTALFGRFTALTAKPSGLVVIGRNMGQSAVVRKLLLGNERGFRGVYRTYKSFYEGPGRRAERLRDSSAVRTVAAIDFGSGVAGNALQHYSRLDKIGAVPGLPTSWSPVTDRF